MSTNFRLVLKEPSAREVFTFGLWSREKAGEGMRKKRTWLNQVRLETELKNVVDSSRRLYKLQTKISGHAVCEWLTLTAGTHHPHQQMDNKAKE